VTIEPETKSWTWVLERRCEECGFDTQSFPSEDLGRLLRLSAEPWPALLSHPSARVRPQEDCWSALEYACHVRDVFAIQRERLTRTLVEDTPVLEPMGRDERVVDDRYNEQDREAVADELAANAEAMAKTIEGVSADDWTRVAIYPYPEPTERTAVWLVRHTVHEGTHHLLDIGRVLRQVRGR
jgi:S-DNA-T family DNA segregation ATPase FtsK/SpoIIIE